MPVPRTVEAVIEPERAGDVPRAVATRIGVFGLLDDRGVVTAVEGGVASYRRMTGALLPVATGGLEIAPGDMIAVRAATLPEGGIVAVAFRRHGDARWTVLVDPASLAEPRHRLRRPVLVAASVAAGALAGLAILPWLTAPAGAVGAAGLVWDRRRRHRDAALLRRLFDLG